MTAHAVCSPSGAAMWMACPASVTKTEGITRPTSKFAREGTAAHHVAQLLLEDPSPFLPDKVTVEGQEFFVTREMLKALRPYVDHIEALSRGPARRWIEERIIVPGTRKRVWGTMDCGIARQEALHIVDLKFGKGVRVQPNSAQLGLYGLGLINLLKNRKPWEGTPVTLTVCQPRLGDGEPLRHHQTTVGELQNWNATAVRPALARIERGDTTESAGPHCRFCVRQRECAAFNQSRQAKAAGLFDDGEGG